MMYVSISADTAVVTIRSSVAAAAAGPASAQPEQIVGTLHQQENLRPMPSKLRAESSECVPYVFPALARVDHPNVLRNILRGQNPLEEKWIRTRGAPCRDAVPERQNSGDSELRRRKDRHAERAACRLLQSVGRAARHFSRADSERACRSAVSIQRSPAVVLQSPRAPGTGRRSVHRRTTASGDRPDKSWRDARPCLPATA